MRIPTRLGVCLILLLAANVAYPQLAPIGLSEVRAQWFDNESLDFYGPDALDHFAAALATGDFNGDGADDLAKVGCAASTPTSTRALSASASRRSSRSA